MIVVIHVYSRVFRLVSTVYQSSCWQIFSFRGRVLNLFKSLDVKLSVYIQDAEMETGQNCGNFFPFVVVSNFHSFFTHTV